MKRNENGITLIALAVTIAILIILTSITMASLTSREGILTKKNEYQEIYSQKQEETENTEKSISNEWGNIINKTGIDEEFNYVS